MSIKFKKSSVEGKTPTKYQLDYGEMSVNFNSKEPFLAIKDSDDNIRKFSDDDTLIKKLGSGGEINLTNYYTKSESNDKFQPKGNYLTEHQSLSDYAKKTDIPSLEDYATKLLVSGYTYDKATIDEKVDSKASKSDIPNLNGYATERWVNEKNYLTQHQSLDGYAKKTDLPSLNGYATEQFVSGYTYDKTTIDAKVDAKADKTSIPSLDGYATQQWVEDKNYLTEHQSLSEYAKKSEIPSLPDFKTINGETITGTGNIEIKTDSGGILTETDPVWTAEKNNYLLKETALETYQPKGTYLTQHQDISGKADKSTTLKGYGIVDAYTKTESDGKYQPKGDYLTQHQDLSDYATKQFVSGYTYDKTAIDAKVDAKADKTSIPSLEGYATEQYVSGYTYDKTAIDGKIDVKANKSDIPSLNGYATEQWVENKNYLTGHQDLSEYAKKSEIPSIPNNLVTGVDKPYKVQSLTKAEYEKLTSKDADTMYYITDATGESGQNVVYKGGKGIEITEDNTINCTLTVPTKTSELTNDSNFLTQHQSLEDYATKLLVSGYTYDKTTIDAKVDAKADKTSIPSLDGYAKITSMTQGEYDALSAKSDNTLYVISE